MKYLANASLLIYYDEAIRHQLGLADYYGLAANGNEIEPQIGPIENNACILRDLSLDEINALEAIFASDHFDSQLATKKLEIEQAIYAWFGREIKATGAMPGGDYSAEMVSDIAFILLEVQQAGGDLSKLNQVTCDRIKSEAANFKPDTLTPEQLVYVWGQKHLEMRQKTAPLIAKRRELLDRLKLLETIEEVDAILAEI